MIKGILCVLLSMLCSFGCAWFVHQAQQNIWWNFVLYMWSGLACTVSLFAAIYFFVRSAECKS
jgi:hypothetical protein